MRTDFISCKLPDLFREKARSPSGKAELCKSSTAGSIQARASNFTLGQSRTSGDSPALCEGAEFEVVWTRVLFSSLGRTEFRDSIRDTFGSAKLCMASCVGSAVLSV